MSCAGVHCLPNQVDRGHVWIRAGQQHCAQPLGTLTSVSPFNLFYVLVLVHGLMLAFGLVLTFGFMLTFGLTWQSTGIDSHL